MPNISGGRRRGPPNPKLPLEFWALLIAFVALLLNVLACWLAFLQLVASVY